MSVGYSKYGVVGGPLSGRVVDQLNARKSVVGKRINRGPDHISYLNSTTGWVRVTSAVDVKDENALEGTEYEYSDALARINQLFGGTYSAISGPRGGFVQREDRRMSDESGYQYSETQGFVPMPGITSFQVQSKGTYGTLRSASFNFTVHSTEQFNIMEQLYLRPGFSILLEWGHSQFIENNGDLNSNVSLYNINKFFNQIEEPTLRRELQYTRSEKNLFNYDFLYGFIKNFSWSYNGVNYECQVDVISKGELISSIRSAFSTFRDSGKEEYSTSQHASEIEGVLNLLKNTAVESVYRKETNIEKIKTSVKDSFIARLEQDYKEYQDIFNNTEILVADLTGNTAGRLTKYITLGTFLKMLNQVGIFKGPKDLPLVEFYTGPLTRNEYSSLNLQQQEGVARSLGYTRDELSQNFDIVNERSPKFTTFPEHVALNPYENVLPKPTNQENTYKVATQANKSTDKILDIFINVDFILNVLEEVNKKEKLDNTLLEVINIILKRTQLNLGDINEFSLHFEEDESLYYVVDRKLVPSKNDFEKGDGNNPKSYIDLVGLDTEVENLNIVSKLSGKLTSMIAIAAQSGPKSSTDADILNVQRWNEGLRDRHLVEKSTGNIDEKSGKVEAEVFQVDKSLLKEYQKFISDINKSGNKIHIGYEEKHFTDAKTLHTEITAQFLKSITTQKNENMPGLIPFELSFTIKGISGMKIGQSFKVNEFFLPERYRGRVAFLITGLDHKVANNRWTTDIKTQMIII